MSSLSQVTSSTSIFARILSIINNALSDIPYTLDSEVRGNLSVRDILKDVVSVPEKERTYIVEYVGYCYSKVAADVIFFLPKVVLTGEQNEERTSDTIFGASPQEIIDFDSDKIKSKFKEEGCKEYKEFLSTLAIWIYRVISVYKKSHNDNILESREYQAESRGKKQKHNTLLDVIIALRDFNRNNQDYFTFIAKNVHSGYNKINWNKTISSSQAIIQDGAPIYAMADGKVYQYYNSCKHNYGKKPLKTCCGNGYGNYVAIDHGTYTGSSYAKANYKAYYAHMGSVTVKNGATVKKGQIIGYIGSTGRSTGAHLHFGIMKNNTWVDPMQFFK